MLGHQPGDGLCCVHAMMAPGGCGTGEACLHVPGPLSSITRVLQAGETVRGVEVRYALQVNGKAQSFWFLISAAPVTLNGVPHALLAITDITDRKRVEESLRETNAYLESLFNYANAPIIVWNPLFRITRFNHAFESLTGRRADKVIGESLEILFPPTLVESSMGRIAETLRGEHSGDCRNKYSHHLDGSVRTVLWNSAPIFGPDGKTPMVTIASRSGHYQA